MDRTIPNLLLSGRTKVKLTVEVRSQESVPMKKFSPPQMKEVYFPTPHTLHPLSSRSSARIARITFLKTDDRIYVRLLNGIINP